MPRYRSTLSALVLLLLATLLAIGTGPGRAAEPQRSSQSLSGSFLVASPELSDPRFSHTVIYIVSHDDKGAMGLVVNRPYGRGPLKSLLTGFGVTDDKAGGTAQLNYGGPVEPEKGFVLHSADYSGPSTLPVTAKIAVSVGRDVLQAMADGGGPAQAIVLLGYAGWGPGQLENELARQDWLVAPGDEKLIFSNDPESVWDRARRHAGLSL